MSKGESKGEVVKVTDPFTCYYDPDHGTYYNVENVVVTYYKDGKTVVACPRLSNGECKGKNCLGKIKTKGKCFRLQS
jgi:hypothetical protein